MDLEIYIRPNERPSMIMTDSNIRVYYSGHWVDFRDGQIRILPDVDRDQADLKPICRYGVSKDPSNCQYFDNGDCGCSAAGE